MWYFTSLFSAAVVLADYDVDNGNASVVYSMPPSELGRRWQTFSTTTIALEMKMPNQTIFLDASNCYDQNYALGVCGTVDGLDCFVQIPFTGSGITMFVFNAGVSGMAANFSIDGGTAVSSTIQAPPPPNYQVSNVSLYDIQGLPSGYHTMKMTMLDWENENTSMKFDYAHINETFVAPPATTSSISSTTSASVSPTSSQTQSAGSFTASRSVNVEDIVGATLGGLALVVGFVICFLYSRRRKALRRDVTSSEPNLEVSPFTSDFGSPTPAFASHAHPFSRRHGINPLTRSAILRDALAAGDYPSSESGKPFQPMIAGHGSGVRPLSQGEDVDIHAAHSITPDVAGAHSSFSSDSQIASPYNLTVEQGEVIQQLRRDNVPPETVTRVIGEFISSNASTGRRLTRQKSITSAVPPPSYQTRDR